MGGKEEFENRSEWRNGKWVGRDEEELGRFREERRSEGRGKRGKYWGDKEAKRGDHQITQGKLECREDQRE